jgi:hypothetical protein
MIETEIRRLPKHLELKESMIKQENNDEQSFQSNR